MFTEATKGNIAPLCLHHLRPMRDVITIRGEYDLRDSWFEKTCYACSECEVCYDRSGYFLYHRDKKRIGNHLSSPQCPNGHGYMYLSDVAQDGSNVWACGAVGCEQKRPQSFGRND